MDKLSSESRSDGIEKAARGYVSEGFNEQEVVELLMADGVDHERSKFLARKSSRMVEEKEDASLWGFEVEDWQGDVASNFDVGCNGISASNDDDAWEQVQEFLDSSESNSYTVIKVYKL